MNILTLIYMYRADVLFTYEYHLKLLLYIKSGQALASP